MQFKIFTGLVGFIGFTFSKKLLERERGDIVIGIDNQDNYYDSKNY